MYFSLVWRAEFLTLPVETIMSVIKKKKLNLLFITERKSKRKILVDISFRIYHMKNVQIKEYNIYGYIVCLQTISISLYFRKLKASIDVHS